MDINLNIIDIFIVSLIVISVYLGYHKGFVKSIYSVLSLVVTYVILYFFKSTLITAIANSQIGELIGSLFVSEAGNTILAEKASSAVIYLVSGVLLYFAVKLILGIALRVLDTLASLPIINIFNKFLGLCIGAVIGMIWVVIALNVMVALPQTIDYVSASELASYFAEFIIF